MSKIGIVGAGNMGRAIAWAMEQLGYDLVILDWSNSAIQYCRDLLKGNHEFSSLEALNLAAKCIKCQHAPPYDVWLNDNIAGCSAVISSLPYHKNLDVATFCIDHQIPYFDLGGSVKVSDDIHSYARLNATKPVLTDLGLAPGWVNIIAEDMYQLWRQKEVYGASSLGLIMEDTAPNTITMMVGGLPQHPNNTLKYTCTWSYDGLVNEYRDDCIVLINGEQKTVRGMGGYQFPIDSGIGPLEAFYTSGGAAHTIATMQERGVQNCSYKTLRYPHHWQLVNFLIHDSGLSDDTITEIFKRTCPAQKDLVIIKVTAEDLAYERIIKSNTTFSAMQQATAFPAASAVHAVLGGQFSDPVLKYTDINPSLFNGALDSLIQGEI